MKFKLILITCLFFIFTTGQAQQRQQQAVTSERAAYNELTSRIFNERDPVQNEKLYRELVSLYGGKSEYKIDASSYYVAKSFLGKNRPEKVLEYLNKIVDTTYKTNAFSYAARESIAVQDYKLGEILIRKTFADLKGDTTSRGMDEYKRIMSELLFYNDKYEEGFPYAKSIYDKKSKMTAVNFNQLRTTYIDYLIKLKKYKEAYPELLNAMKTGSASQLMKDSFKAAYVAANGSEKGLNELTAGFQQGLRDKAREEIAKKMMNTKATDFAVKDLNGKTVHLSDYKGKVVVLDFWATWCGPCKASFPMMQKTVDHYKNDKDVVFLFIHTMENGGDPAKAAGDYIKDMKYTFNVMMDLKDTSGRNPVASAFNINAIPVKVIIDRQGNIRFKSLGSGTDKGDDAFMEEMSAMIDLAKAE